VDVYVTGSNQAVRGEPGTGADPPTRRSGFAWPLTNLPIVLDNRVIHLLVDTARSGLGQRCGSTPFSSTSQSTVRMNSSHGSVGCRWVGTVLTVWTC
jgi:hypothetical protein